MSGRVHYFCGGPPSGTVKYHERKGNNSLNGKPKATASIGLLYFEGAEPRINVNFSELSLGSLVGGFPFFCSAGM